MKTSQDRVIGVMQIINAKTKPSKGGKHNKKTVRKERTTNFTKSDMMYVNFFANNASVAVERAVMTRQIILRMIKMAELRDPKETGNHVNRVGSYAIEIYEQWARNRSLPDKEIKRVKDTLRIAAMLHDVGKVAISDNGPQKTGQTHGRRILRDADTHSSGGPALPGAGLGLGHHVSGNHPQPP